MQNPESEAGPIHLMFLSMEKRTGEFRGLSTLRGVKEVDGLVDA